MCLQWLMFVFTRKYLLVVKPSILYLNKDHMFGIFSRATQHVYTLPSLCSTGCLVFAVDIVR